LGHLSGIKSLAVSQEYNVLATGSKVNINESFIMRIIHYPLSLFIRMEVEDYGILQINNSKTVL
jgi:hypothetical protein